MRVEIGNAQPRAIYFDRAGVIGRFLLDCQSVETVSPELPSGVQIGDWRVESGDRQRTTTCLSLPERV